MNIKKEISEKELWDFAYKETQRYYVGGLMPHKDWIKFCRRFHYFWDKLNDVKEVQDE